MGRGNDIVGCEKKEKNDLNATVVVVVDGGE